MSESIETRFLEASHSTIAEARELMDELKAAADQISSSGLPDHVVEASLEFYDHTINVIQRLITLSSSSIEHIFKLHESIDKIIETIETHEKE